MERAVQVFAAIQCFVMGLSHVVQPRVWAEFFIWLRSRGHAGVFVSGFISLSFGAIVVAFHDVWSGIPLLLTLLGWSQVLKALLHFTVPSYGLRKLERVSLDRAWEFQVAGGVLLALGVLLCYHLLGT